MYVHFTILTFFSPSIVKNLEERPDAIHQVVRRRERSRLENYPDALIASSGEEEKERTRGE